MSASLTAAADKKYRPDWWLFLVTLILLSFGVTMVFDASYPHDILFYGDKAFFFKRQAFSAALGLAGMFVACRIRFWKWRGWGVSGIVIALLMLVAVMVPHIGHGAQGAQRWLGYGQFRIQPSEIAKLALVLFMASALAGRPQRIHDFWRGIFPLFVVAGGAILLVERQPDLGTAITMLLTVLIMLFAAGARARWVLGMLAACAAVGLVMVLHKGTDSYRWKRLTTFVDPSGDKLSSGYQIIHSTIALGTGGWTGLGFGESREKQQGNLPAQRTDFIFAIVGEEFGLVGTCGVLALFLILAARGLHIAHRTKDPFGALLATGITTMVSVQALVNIGVVSASIPATGVPLPFISYGGSSLVLTLFGIGILLNISQYPFRTDPRLSTRRRRGDDLDNSDASEPRASAARRPGYDRERTAR